MPGQVEWQGGAQHTAPKKEMQAMNPDREPGLRVEGTQPGAPQASSPPQALDEAVASGGQCLPCPMGSGGMAGQGPPCSLPRSRGCGQVRS